MTKSLQVANSNGLEMHVVLQELEQQWDGAFPLNLNGRKEYVCTRCSTKRMMSVLGPLGLNNY